MSKYNGWKNYETWNVALWLSNDEELYNLAKRAGSYETLLGMLATSETPDGVEYASKSLDVDALDRTIKEFN